MDGCQVGEPDLAMSLPALADEPPRTEPSGTPSVTGVDRGAWPTTRVDVPRQRETGGPGLETAALRFAGDDRAASPSPTAGQALELDRSAADDLRPRSAASMASPPEPPPRLGVQAPPAGAMPASPPVDARPGATLPASARLARDVDAYGRAAMPADPAARLAFLCNAYNANALLKAVEAARRPGFTSVKDTPGFFDRDLIVVAGESMTLDQLEHDRIRPLGDPRVHAALVCGARSCPPLPDEPLDPARLDEQLDEQCRRWVNDPSMNFVRGDTLLLSPIFDWYGADFRGDSGAGVIEFLRRYAAPDGPIAALLQRVPDPTIEWLPYDWSLPAGAVELQEPPS
jgi:hypothetical protein